MVKIQKVFLFSSILIFLIFILTFIVHLKIVLLPIVSFLAGIGIRLLFRTKYLVVFSFIFPLIPALAYFENKGMPFNYLLLPLIVLFGVFIGDLVFNNKYVWQLLSHINQYYILLLSLIVVSSLFLVLKWSNATLLSNAFFSDTPIVPQKIRLSFGIIFPIIYSCLFFISYLFFLYVKKYDRKRDIIIAFLAGHSVSVLFSFIQNIFKVEWFLFNRFNGFASDKSTFGFLSAISILFALFIFHKYKAKILGISFLCISILGIINSTRIGFLAIIIAVLYFLSHLKGKQLILFLIFLIVCVTGLTLIVNNTDVTKNFGFFKDISHNINTIKGNLDTRQNGSKWLRKLSGGRDNLWEYSFSALKEFPFCGVGSGNFLFWVHYYKYGKPFHHDFSGNQYLFIASSLGITGLLVFIMFLLNLWSQQSGFSKWLFVGMAMVIFFDEYFWVAEAFLAFWLLVAMGEKDNGDEIHLTWKNRLFLGMVFLIFISSNIFHFSALHPKNWAKETGTAYDYGLWYPESNLQGEVFSWTKGKAGIYLYLDSRGQSKKIRLFCGAPLQFLEDKKQRVRIYWRAEPYKTFVFNENRMVEFLIEDPGNTEGFLEFRIDPEFNLKRMGISQEARSLGVQFFYPH